jgi:hypothetical protein
MSLPALEQGSFWLGGSIARETDGATSSARAHASAAASQEVERIGAGSPMRASIFSFALR